MREICTSGLTRGEASILPYSTGFLLFSSDDLLRYYAFDISQPEIATTVAIG
jgi:hypothetical protein